MRMASINDLLTNPNKFLNERNKQTAHIFHGYIKESFLTKMNHMIGNSPSFNELMLVKGRYNDNFDLGAVSKQDFYYDIAVNVAMSHWYYTTPIRNDEHAIAMKYEDKKHEDKLFHTALEQCNLRLLLTPSDRISFFTHIPVVFAMTCLTNYLLDEFGKYLNGHQKHLMEDKVDLFKYNSLVQALKSTRTIISTFEIGDFSNAYSLLRTLIESLFTYIDIRNNEEAINAYYEFLTYKSVYDETGEYPEDFKNKAPSDRRLWSNYLNNGWLDCIKGDDKINYVFKDIVAYCPIPEFKNDSMWLETYKKCSNFVHGDLLVVEAPDQGICSVSSYLAPLLVNVANFSLNFLGLEDAIYDKNDKDGGVDLIQNLKNKNEELQDMLLSSGKIKKLS